MSKSTCKFCNTKIGIKKMPDHLPDCIFNACSDKTGYLIEFTSSSYITNKEYSMFAIFGHECKFSHIDKFLRQNWCECCSHMSTLDVFEEVNDEQSHKSIKFTTPISKYSHANQFCYCYDMGSTTTIYFRIIGILYGNELNLKTIPNPDAELDKKIINTINQMLKNKTTLKLKTNTNTNTNIELIYRNEPFVFKCKNKCKRNATIIFDEEKYCSQCVLEEPDYEEECVLAIVNSPRVGVCGYC